MSPTEKSSMEKVTKKMHKEAKEILDKKETLFSQLYNTYGRAPGGLVIKEPDGTRVLMLLKSNVCGTPEDRAKTEQLLDRSDLTGIEYVRIVDCYPGREHEQ